MGLRIILGAIGAWVSLCLALSCGPTGQPCTEQQDCQPVMVWPTICTEKKPGQRECSLDHPMSDTGNADAGGG